MKILIPSLITCLSIFYNCTPSQKEIVPNEDIIIQDSVKTEKADTIKAIHAENITIEKDLLYDKHTLKDTYPYKDTTRQFQWDKIRKNLALLETIQQKPSQWGILQNYKNRNGEAPLIRNYIRNAYKRVSDTLGIERYQSAPLYLLSDTIIPEKYGHDGELVRIKGKDGNFIQIETIYTPGEWMVPQRYIGLINDTVTFNKAIFVDRHNQNIATLEKANGKWLVRSMNPSTTGLHRPPYAQETPLGIFVIQEKKPKMIYLVDGSQETGGFAPYASRFTDGAYIHGVPVNAPRTAPIEYSPSLGTTPRSHMCVRNATSHAKFIYGWTPVNETIVFVLE
ncbi:L,D-transpeptidase [Parabacteroides chinchillae]|uniref:Lipoprotein-anchoring transpeptidase ErfK/SrfK n=1 Tax=Parabacteroides chinchillae TaxID=871327 RepID=A0A8G2BTZ8_9BACT|nr:L,D-transpeptidase [Parabacteroides chinchillae]SEF46943.1 Lipoprotein-anchoring transpeptidase ErfK/SrfK [Parabacteroides chinchillae]